jgi:outer membrane lipoprotein-sorting protein
MRYLFAALMLALFLPFAAHAGPYDNTPEVRAVETYLANLKAVKARFLQTSNDGSRFAGDFMLKRPGRMRFEYDAPSTDFITADGVFIYYYDGRMKEQKNALISNSLADFFLRTDVRLSGDVRVTDVRRDDAQLLITVVQEKDPTAGSMTMIFTEKPKMELKKWRVVDAHGTITEIELHDIQTGIKLENEAFRYYDPQRRQPNYN